MDRAGKCLTVCGERVYTKDVENKGNAHISLHLTASNPAGTLVVQPRNADGTFRSPVPSAKAEVSTFHVADYTRKGIVRRARLSISQ